MLHACPIPAVTLMPVAEINAVKLSPYPNGRNHLNRAEIYYRDALLRNNPEQLS